ITPTPGPLGEGWYHDKPIVMNSVTQFRCPPPPALDSAEYAEAFEEVVRLGGDGVITPTERTPEQTQIGIFWAYDGTPSLCAPPRLYNQLARTIADQYDLDAIEYARLFALVNVALADAGIAIWDSKYHHNFWRPCTGVREADAGTGPTGLGDGNPDTIADPTFTALGAPASNLSAKNFTPPFPTYPSGHAGFGGALFETLRNYFGTDDIEFTFVSDELNGVTRDNEGNVRDLVPMTFGSLSEAEESNGQSRVYLGIHWSFDKTSGIEMGNDVAQHVYRNVYLPQ
ncbi:MAG: vanadium-dependent haloperoxidase, partial [Phycisphaerae bacterium]